MKKFFIGMTGIALCLCLTACGKTSNPSSVSSLSNQLDSTANALTSISTISPAQISYNCDNKNDTLLRDSELTQQSLLNEQYYRAEILDQTAILKNKLTDITLSKAQKSALNDLTNTLNKYTNSILNSKYEMSSSAKAISSMKKNSSKNEEKLRAKYNRLACNSNMRSAYYENILNTLDEIENCLNLTCENCQPQNVETPKAVEEQSTNEKQTVTEEKSKTTLKKNIDTYQTVDENEDNIDEEFNFIPERGFRRRYYKNRNNTVYNRFDRFNPSRNTDTYGPNRRNIDSFGGYGYNGYGFRNGYGMPSGYGYGNFGVNGAMPYTNNGYGFGNNFYAGSNYGNRLNAPAMYANAENEAEKRLETFEKKAEDGTIEKIENDNTISDKNCDKNEDCTQTSAMGAPETALRKLKDSLRERQEDQKVVAHKNI